MSVLYIMWRHTAIRGVASLPQVNVQDTDDLVSLLVLPLQLFDDLFTDIIFLSVEPFSTLFVVMILFYFIRDVGRDAGLGWILWDWMRGRRYDIEEKGKTLLLRYHLAEQNLLSEMLAVMVVPFIVGSDVVFSQFNIGVNTISFGLEFDDQIQVLQMYTILIAVALLDHAVVRFLLRRQLTNFRSQASRTPRSIHQNRPRTKSHRVVKSILQMDQSWSVRAHGICYFFYGCVCVCVCVCMCVYVCDE